MSSFKIIKAVSSAETGLARFSFETLAEPADTHFFPSSDGFQPMFAAASCPSDSIAAAHEADSSADDDELNEKNTHLSEEELQQMLMESFAKGVAEGEQQTQERFTTAFQSLDAAVEQVNGLGGRLIRQSEEDLLQLAMMVAKQIIQREVTQDREILAQFVAEAVRGIVDQEELVISFNPEDCRIVSEKRHLYLAGIGDKRHITIKPDDSIPIGGCVIDTPSGLVDACVDAQLAEVFKQLMQERNHHSDAAQTLQVAAEPFSADHFGIETYDYPKD